MPESDDGVAEITAVSLTASAAVGSNEAVPMFYLASLPPLERTRPPAPHLRAGATRSACNPLAALADQRTPNPKRRFGPQSSPTLGAGESRETPLRVRGALARF